MKNEKIYLVIREYSESYEYGTSITAFSTKDKAVEEFQKLIAEEVKHGLGRYYCEDKETLTSYAQGRCVGLWYDDGESWNLWHSEFDKRSLTRRRSNRKYVLNTCAKIARKKERTGNID